MVEKERKLVETERTPKEQSYVGQRIKYGEELVEDRGIEEWFIETDRSVGWAS